MHFQTKGQVIDANGNIVDDGDPVLRQGQTYRVPVILMDAKQGTVTSIPAFADPMTGHRPGYAFTSDQERKRRIQQQVVYNASIEQRWRSGSTAEKPTATQQQTADARVRAYAAYEQRLTNSWRHR